MPVLDILDENGRLRPHDAGMWVFAAMAYPHDEVKRNAIAATGLQRALVELGRDVPASVAGTVYEAGGKSLEDDNSAQDNGQIAGHTLYTLTSLAKHRPAAASLSRAQHLVRESRLTDKRRDGTKLTASKSIIKTAWSDYKAVSHLWAVVVHAQILNHDRSDEALDSDVVPWFLGIAAELERFAVQYRAPGAQDSLVADTDIWRIPDFVGQPKLRFSAPELSKDQHRWLREYRHALK